MKKILTIIISLFFLQTARCATIGFYFIRGKVVKIEKNKVIAMYQGRKSVYPKFLFSGKKIKVDKEFQIKLKPTQVNLLVAGIGGGTSND